MTQSPHSSFVLTSGALMVGQLWIMLRSLVGKPEANAPVLPIAEVEELAVGGAKTFAYPEGSTPRLLVRMGQAKFVAYDQCTHLLMSNRARGERRAPALPLSQWLV